MSLCPCIMSGIEVVAMSNCGYGLFFGAGGIVVEGNMLQWLKAPLGRSVCLHVLLLLVCATPFFSTRWSINPGLSHQSSTMVQAVAVSAQQAQQQVDQVLAQRAKEQRAIADARAKRLAKAKAVAKARAVAKAKAAALARAKVQAQAKAKARAVALAREKAQAKAQALKEAQAKAQALAVQKKESLAKQLAALQQKQQSEQWSSDHQQVSSALTQYQQGVINQYTQQVARAIQPYWYVTRDIDKNLTSEFLIRVAPDGTVLSVTLTASSGQTALDRSARLAIMKASPLPVPKDAELFDKFREFTLIMSPKNVIMRSDMT